MARKHNSLREGAWLGVVVATSIWVWLAVVDAAVGQPFRTFTVLGGLALCTILHYLFNVVYDIVIVPLVHGAAREPSLVIGMAFGFLVIEFGFVMITVLLSHMGLGELAWARILGGNLIGAAIAFVMLSRRHRLRDEFRQAEEAENERGTPRQPAIRPTSWASSYPDPHPPAATSTGAGGGAAPPTPRTTRHP